MVRHTVLVRTSGGSSPPRPAKFSAKIWQGKGIEVGNRKTKEKTRSAAENFLFPHPNPGKCKFSAKIWQGKGIEVGRG